MFDIRNRQDLYSYCFGFASNYGDFDSAKLTITSSMELTERELSENSGI